jgi:Zn-dependent M28 family amino/carboxypeptidase
MRLLIVTVLLATFQNVQSQFVSNIGETDVTRIEKILSSDSMQGRKVYSPGIEIAADFITKEFNSAGLKFYNRTKSFRQSFTTITPETIEVSATVNGSPLNKKNIFVFSADSSVTINEHDNYQKVFIRKGEDFLSVIYQYLDASQNFIIVMDTSFSGKFEKLGALRMPQFVGSGNRIFMVTAEDPKEFKIKILQKRKLQTLSNLIGILPGKTRPDEYIIFSAHYDHLGTGPADPSGDSVFNGANDDASGITAIITLAKHFSKLDNNQRTLIFVAFTAEEVGEFGSQFFSKKIDPKKIVAMLNIEMIGTQSKWARNTAYITGYDKSDLGAILSENLKGSSYMFFPDPYPDQMLFLRSDNASLAKLGVPAHTISTSKMDSDRYYHQRNDEFQTLDISNMTEIIRAIAISTGPIVDASVTPKRVHPD